MYGLINRAIQELISDQYGETIWIEIKENSQVDVDNFLAMSTYPDEATYRLVEEASKILGLSENQIFEAFGEYWILYTAQEGYGPLLDAAGDTFVDFLQNLNDLHARVSISMPDLKPPKLVCSDINRDSMRLHYYSERPDLTPLVIGLLKGLGKKFKTPIEIRLDKSKAAGLDHDEFFITFLKE